MGNSSSKINNTNYFLLSLIIEHKPDKEDHDIWR